MPPQPASPGVVRDASHLFALCGFAIAQPLFDLLGKNPTFFVAHDLDGFDLVLFALVVLIGPPLLLFAVLTATRLISAAAARMTRAVLAGLLVAFTILPPLERAVGLSTTVWVTLLVISAVAAAAAYDRFRHLRTFITYLAVAPLLFLVVFLFLTPVRTLILAADPEAVAVDLQGTRTPVVVVVLDELPLGVLLDDDGAIDAIRFPGFARLADISTWYPKTTTVSSHTIQAVPAIMSGQSPPPDAVPVASNYPRSLFTLFARSHHLHVNETVTQICPRDLCDRSTSDVGPVDSPLTDDVETVFWRALLPDDTASAWGVPTIDDRWAGFGHVTTAPRAPTGPQPTGSDFSRDEIRLDTPNEATRFEAFLGALGKGRSPGLWFFHSLLPHVPYALLPDGGAYNARYVPPPGSTRADNVDLVHLDAQRLVLQTMYVDTLMDELLDRLQQTGILDEALVVVAADHGVAFVPGTVRRDTSNARGRDGVLPVPLFVKYPGQTSGEIDRRDARTPDVLPTIVDALGIDLPAGWHFDGRSLIGDPRSGRPPHEVNGTRYADRARAQRLADELGTFLVSTREPHDEFRLGPFGDLVGEPATSLTVGSPSGSVHADKWSAYDDVASDRFIPALFQATVTGVEPGQWVAVTLNGTVAGVGPAYRLDGATETRVAVMLDPSLMAVHANVLEVYRIDTDRSLHQLTPLR